MQILENWKKANTASWQPNNANQMARKTWKQQIISQNTFLHWEPADEFEIDEKCSRKCKLGPEESAKLEIDEKNARKEEELMRSAKITIYAFNQQETSTSSSQNIRWHKLANSRG